MSILKTDNNNQVDEEDDAKKPKFVSITLENNPKQPFSNPKLRSILRKNVEKKVSTNAQQIPILINENDNNNERDSDYTGDEDEEDFNAGNISIEKESQPNEQHYRHFSHQEQKDQPFQTLSLTSSVKPLETRKTSIEKLANTINDQSPSRTACVTFTDEQPTIIHRSSSTPPFEGHNIELRPLITYINMKEDLPTSTTTTTTTTAMTSDFRPVYVSPLKYRPLLGLSANDTRLLLEKRVSLLGKPLVFHPIQKRSQAYRRTQLRIYNFLERADGYKAIIYHTFV
jgi:hypothetical protein